MSSFPSCQVCKQNFSLKGPAPYLLPCLHAVCETCVTSAAGGVIYCSPCQRDVNLAETRLQKDVVREKEILHQTVRRNPEQVLCTHEEDGNQAVCWCKECDEFLCEHCQMVHNSFKITKQHNIHDVEAMEVGNLNEDRYCTFHPKLIADTWDKDCCILTCGKCRRGDHAGHDVADVEEAADIARNEITKLGKDIMPTIDQHRAHLAEGEKDIKSLDDKSSTLDGKISFTFDSFKVQLDQREKELKIALQNQKGNIKDRLNTRKTTSETGYQRCLTTSDYFNKTLKYSSMHDISELKQLLEDKFQDCRSSAPSEDYESPPLPVFNTDGLDRVKSTLAHFGTIATEDTVLTNQMQDNWSQTEEDVMQELERLKQELKLVKTSQEDLIRQKEETERVNFKEKEKMKKELKRVKTSQENLIREKEETERENFKQKEKIKEELKRVKTSQENLIREKEETERENFKQKEKIKEELKRVKTSQENLIREKEETERENFKQKEKLKEELKRVKTSQENLIREKEETERENFKQKEKIKEELKRVKTSQENLIREKEETERENFKQKEKLKEENCSCMIIILIPISVVSLPLYSGELKRVKTSQENLIREKEETERENFKQKEKLKEELKRVKTSQENLIREKEETERENFKQKEKLKEALKRVKTSQENLIREKEKTERENFKQKEKLKEELKRVKTSQENLIREKEETERVNSKEKEKTKEELKELKAVQQKIIQQEQEVERFTGLYRLRTQALEHSFLLKCTDVNFSKTKYNAEKVHINTEGELINKSQTDPPDSDQRLKNYTGTSSTVRLPQCGSPQYFEVKSRVGIEETLTGNILLLEIGLAREEEQDQSYWIGGQSQSYSLNVAYCSKHSSICREVWRHGNRHTCLPDTLENTPGTSASLHYGVVYDSDRRRIAFLDVENDKLIGKIEDVDSSVALWLMFGVYNSDWASVGMSLVVWSDIDMTKQKKQLILDCLS